MDSSAIPDKDDVQHAINIVLSNALAFGFADPVDGHFDINEFLETSAGQVALSLANKIFQPEDGFTIGQQDWIRSLITEAKKEIQLHPLWAEIESYQAVTHQCGCGGH